MIRALACVGDTHAAQPQPAQARERRRRPHSRADIRAVCQLQPPEVRRQRLEQRKVFISHISAANKRQRLRATRRRVVCGACWKTRRPACLCPTAAVADSQAAQKGVTLSLGSAASCNRGDVQQRFNKGHRLTFRDGNRSQSVTIELVKDLQACVASHVCLSRDRRRDTQASCGQKSVIPHGAW